MRLYNTFYVHWTHDNISLAFRITQPATTPPCNLYYGYRLSSVSWSPLAVGGWAQMRLKQQQLTTYHRILFIKVKDTVELHSFVQQQHEGWWKMSMDTYKLLNRNFILSAVDFLLPRNPIERSGRKRVHKSSFFVFPPLNLSYLNSIKKINSHERKVESPWAGGKLWLNEPQDKMLRMNEHFVFLISCCCSPASRRLSGPLLALCAVVASASAAVVDLCQHTIDDDDEKRLLRCFPCLTFLFFFPFFFAVQSSMTSGGSLLSESWNKKKLRWWKWGCCSCVFASYPAENTMMGISRRLQAWKLLINSLLEIKLFSSSFYLLSFNKSAPSNGEDKKTEEQTKLIANENKNIKLYSKSMRIGRAMSRNELNFSLLFSTRTLLFVW